jgi:hypothetical protein
VSTPIRFPFSEILHVSMGLVRPGAPWDGMSRLMGGLRIPTHVVQESDGSCSFARCAAPSTYTGYCDKIQTFIGSSGASTIPKSAVISAGCTADVCCELLRKWNWKRRARSVGAGIVSIPHLIRSFILYGKRPCSKGGEVALATCARDWARPCPHGEDRFAMSLVGACARLWRLPSSNHSVQ